LGTEGKRVSSGHHGIAVSDPQVGAFTATDESEHPVWCLGIAQSELRLGRITEQMNGSEIRDNNPDVATE
jgi:hypothetical protein